MSPDAAGLILVAAAYLTGSIPFGFLIGRLVRGIDIRQHGSGNIGASNVGRVLGGGWGVAVLILDLLKGLGPVWGLARLLLPHDDPGYVHWQVAAGVATIVGHIYPCWLWFRGGKGVATALGVVICLGGWSTLIAAGAFAVTFALWRIMSVSSMAAAVCFAVAQFVRLGPHPFSSGNWSMAIFSLLVPTLILIRHRTNIIRLVRGEEARYRLAKPHAEARQPQASDQV